MTFLSEYAWIGVLWALGAGFYLSLLEGDSDE